MVNAYQALTTTTIISPNQLALNDTVRKAASYTINVTNIGNEVAAYKISHGGAALATGKTSDNDQLLAIPNYSADYAVSFSTNKIHIDKIDERKICYTPFWKVFQQYSI